MRSGVRSPLPPPTRKRKAASRAAFFVQGACRGSNPRERDSPVGCRGPSAHARGLRDAQRRKARAGADPPYLHQLENERPLQERPFSCRVLAGDRTGNSPAGCCASPCGALENERPLQERPFSCRVPSDSPESASPITPFFTASRCAPWRARCPRRCQTRSGAHTPRRQAQTRHPAS